MSVPREAARLITATVHRAFADADDATRVALIDEHLASFSEPDAPSSHIARIRDRELLLVHDGGRAWIAAWDAAGERSNGDNRDGAERSNTPFVLSKPQRGTSAAVSKDGERASPFPIEHVIVGGPPGGYIVSGIASTDDGERAWFERAGFVIRGTHCDLRVVLSEPRALDARVRRARRDEAEGLAEWISAQFAPAWAREVTRSLRMHDAVFVAEANGEYAGFSAHSGHNVAVATFGPVGVSMALRGAGLGAALSRAALDDLHARGHREATIPWVDPGRVAFYRALVAGMRVEERVALSLRP